jgi:uncharacterized membrane protein
MRRLSTFRTVSIGINGIFYVGAGCLHFIRPAMYIRIVPPYLPWHSQLVAVSGVFEILGGAGLLLPATRRAAAWGLVVLLIAVFPANLYMATNPAEAGAATVPPGLLWARLLLQAVLIWWVLWCTDRPGALIRVVNPDQGRR